MPTNQQQRSRSCQTSTSAQGLRWRRACSAPAAPATLHTQSCLTQMTWMSWQACVTPSCSSTQQYQSRQAWQQQQQQHLQAITQTPQVQQPSSSLSTATVSRNLQAQHGPVVLCLVSRTGSTLHPVLPCRWRRRWTTQPVCQGCRPWRHSCGSCRSRWLRLSWIQCLLVAAPAVMAAAVLVVLARQAGTRLLVQATLVLELAQEALSVLHALAVLEPPANTAA